MKSKTLIAFALICTATATARPIDWTRVHLTTMRGLDQLYSLNINQALAEFDSVSRMAPGDPRGPFFESMVHFYLYGLSLNQKELDLFFEKSEHVIGICETLLDQNENDATTKFYLGGIYGYRGLAYQSSGSILKAVRDGRKGYLYLEDAVRQDSTLYDAQMGFGLFRYLIAKLPKSMSYLLNLLGFGGDLEGGLQSLRMAAERGVYTRVEARLFLSQFLFNEGRPDTAMQYVRELCAKYPTNTLFFVLYASWENRLGNIDLAFPAALKAMDLNKRNSVTYGEALIYSTLGSVYFTKNMFDSARVYYRKYMAMTTSDERTPNYTFLRAGEACEIAGDRAAAMEFYKRMREPHDRTWDTRNYRRGQQLLQRPLSPAETRLIMAGNESVQKHFDRSAEMYREALREAASDVDLQLQALYGLQQVQFDSGRLDDAVGTSRKILSLTPTVETWIIPHAWFRLGLIYEKQGKLADARDALESVSRYDGYEFQSRLEQEVKEQLGKLNAAPAKDG